MVWTEIPLDGRTYLYMFTRGHMMAAIHRNDILEHIVSPHAGVFGDAFILMQDISRAHTARVSLIFFDDEGTSVMNWPTSSPDLNPLEHTRDILTRCIRQRSHYPENIHNRIDALVKELQAIP